MAVALRDLEQQHVRHHPVLRVVPSQPSPPPTPPGVFWFRRLLVLLVAAAVVLGAIGVLHATTADAATDHLEVTVVVPPGGTLWDIAARYAPADADRASWVTAVADRNDLDPGAIAPGTAVSVPVDADRVIASPERTADR